MDTARRSSRAARSSQPLQSTSNHSSASSNSSGRADRATRSHQKTESARKSTPSGSLSSESPEDTITAIPEDTIQKRRKHARGDDRDNKGSKPQTVEVEMTNGTEEDAEDDGTVRCICGYEDYHFMVRPYSIFCDGIPLCACDATRRVLCSVILWSMDIHESLLFSVISF